MICPAKTAKFAKVSLSTIVVLNESSNVFFRFIEIRFYVYIHILSACACEIFICSEFIQGGKKCNTFPAFLSDRTICYSISVGRYVGNTRVFHRVLVPTTHIFCDRGVSIYSEMKIQLRQPANAARSSVYGSTYQKMYPYIVIHTQSKFWSNMMNAARSTDNFVSSSMFAVLFFSFKPVSSTFPDNHFQEVCKTLMEWFVRIKCNQNKKLFIFYTKRWSKRYRRQRRRCVALAI